MSTSNDSQAYCLGNALCLSLGLLASIWFHGRLDSFATGTHDWLFAMVASFFVGSLVWSAAWHVVRLFLPRIISRYAPEPPTFTVVQRQRNGE